MTKSTYASILSMIDNLIQAAETKGLAPINPVRMSVPGSGLQSDLYPPEAVFIIAYEKPLNLFEEIVWVDAFNRKAFKYDPRSNSWTQMYSYADVYIP